MVDADSSQSLALVDVNDGRNLVVQGPPGTGKSQTITNMIAEALGGSRTVLFVSEKMAALEVVKRRLDGVGLGDACLELHSPTSPPKKSVLDELHRTLDAGRPKLTQTQSDLDTLTSSQQRLNAYCDAVNEPVRETGVNPYRAYGELALLQQSFGAEQLPKLEIPSIQGWTEADFHRREEMVRELQARISALGVPQDHPFWGVRRRALLPTDQERLRLALPPALASLTRLTAAAASLADALGLPKAETGQVAQVLCLAARRVMDAPNLKDARLRSPDWLGQRDEVEALMQVGSKLHHLHLEYDPVLVPQAWDRDTQETRRLLEENGRKLWRVMSSEYRQAKAGLAALCNGHIPKGLDAQLRMLDAVEESKRLRARLDQGDALGRSLLGPIWQGPRSAWPDLPETTRWVLQLLDDIQSGALPVEIVDFLSEGRAREGLDYLASELAARSAEHSGNTGSAVEALDLDVNQRFGTGDSLEILDFNVQKEALETWSRRIGDIHEIASFNSARDTFDAEGVGPVISLAASWTEAGENLLDAFRQAWYQAIVNTALAEREELSAFDGASHQQVVERFRELDSQLLEHNRASLARAHWEALPHQGDTNQASGGQMGILRRQFALRRRHLPIRQLIAQAGNAVQVIKPVFMMSPLSIATYIPPGSLRFDLVIFDEASQVRPVDALGAIMRAGQAVVVGDSQQLPPTNFFDSATSGEEGDEDNITADIQSVLELFEAQNSPERMLRWHYRSRHESLIAVSNQEFYEGKLVLFPSPDSERLETGLSLSYLPNTVYDRGRSRTNPLEAEAVAQAVMEHARSSPELTLGVAAFSAAQMGAIEDQLELLRRQDASLENFFGAHTTEPFFVKNLETVQGDERDVMFISIGYGRDANGQVAMNFGPLNQEGGQRRLNVLITRAKQRCRVFTNLTADDIDLGRTNSRGVAALKTFLSYAKDGVLDVPKESLRDADSPFEESVAKSLSDLGYVVRRHIGSAGYFVDLAVVDPSRPGRYLLGIECDGASYHSSRSARDRDRLRQAVLELKGWRIHRIWSTDWFKNPGRQLERLVEAIHQAESVASAEKTANEDVAKDKNLPETEPAVEREDASAEEPKTVGISEYQVAHISPKVEANDISNASEASILLWVAKVVEVESPVNLQEVARRIADAGGFRKVRRFREAIDHAVEQAVESGAVRRQGEFLWLAETYRPKLRNRSNLPAASRKIALVAPEEIAEAVGQVVEASYGIKRAEISGASIRLLGFNQVSKEMRSHIDPVIAQMLRDGTLEQQGEQIVISGTGNS